MTQNHIAISFLTPNEQEKAKELANLIHSPIIPFSDPHCQSYEYLLILTSEYLGLQNPPSKKFDSFYIDFFSKQMQYRCKKANLKNEAIAKALGCKPSEKLRIVDATAGLGRDSFILATLGYEVMMLERSPIIWALLQDALTRAKIKAPTIVNRLQLIYTNAIDWLNKLLHHQRPHIIYLDPMFPPRKKSAAVKKEMQILQKLVPDSKDLPLLLQVSRSKALKRVIVKRPKNADKIVDFAENFCIMGKTNRFDVYLT